MKEIKEQEALLGKQRSEILNEGSIREPTNKKIAKIQDEYASLEKDILQHCGKISNIIAATEAPGFFVWSDNIKVSPSEHWIGEYELGLPSRNIISFENADRANACRDQFVQHRDEIIQYARAAQNIVNEEYAALQENEKRNSSKLGPLSERGKDLFNKDQELNIILKDLKPRLAQEKFFGSSINLKGQAAGDKTDEAKIDWARVIETNATRIGALAAMFFLVTILVPQYRYNIRMASFYEARSDSLGMLPEAMSADDFDKVVSIMTPNIDFGKAPPTPWEQIIEVIKTAKS